MSSDRNADEALVLELKRNYRRPAYLRPRTSNNGPLDLYIGLYPNIVDVDEKTALVTLGSCIFLTWEDSLLSWDPAAHEGIKAVRLPASDVWTPDIRAARCLSSHTTEPLLIVRHSGQVTYLPYAVYKLQGTTPAPSGYRVTVELGSWTFDSSEVNLKVAGEEGAGLDEFIEGPVWRLRNQGVTIVSKDYGPEGEAMSFPGAKYALDIVKKPK